jgi:uncharacterized phage protein gp47/JayE
MATFQIKSFVSITASMINRMRSVTSAVTDYNVGSVVRTMLEAVAQEINQFYIQMFNALKDAILTATYLTFSFEALPAVSASGQVVVTFTAQPGAITIPAGTVFTPITGNGTSYTNLAAATLIIGATQLTVQVVASTSGIAGNIAAGQAFTLSAPPAGFVGATNPATFSNGAPAESDDARKLRFQNFIVNLARSPTGGIAFGLKTTQILDSNGNIVEQVVSSLVYEPYVLDNTQPVGKFFCYIHNGVGNTSAALVAAAQQVINGYIDGNGNTVVGYKAAGTAAVVAAATEQALAVAAALTVQQGYVKATVAQAVSQGITSYILASSIGGPVLRAQLDEIAMDTPGVANFVLSNPTADVVAAYNVKLMPSAPVIS